MHLTTGRCAATVPDTAPARLGGRARGCRKAASAFSWSQVIRANLYIDGFNLYYRALRNTSNRWLDLGRLAQHLLPGHHINRIRYFTARVKSRPDDPTQAQRQQVYLRALRTVPNVSVHFGRMQTNRKRRPLATPPRSTARIVEIIETEEKGSDVNLASYLLLDGFNQDYELAVVISNDSDLKLPIQMVRDSLEQTIGVIDPSSRRSFELAQSASWYRRLRRGPLSACQFPEQLSDEHGAFVKPAGW